MKYSVEQCVNGNFSIVSEHNEDISAARNAFWDRCKALNSASDVHKGVVRVTDENLEVVEGKIEYIYHGENTPE